VKPYACTRDPVWWLACACYAINRWGVPLAWKGPFLRGHCNDLFLIPAALPVALWLQRRMGLRHSDAPPGWREVGLHLAIWSVTAEGIAPHLLHRATGDWRDVVAYAIGAVVATVLWTA
jgi:hypothetical protein